jgi:two-component sensor histidine kinase
MTTGNMTRTERLLSHSGGRVLLTVFLVAGISLVTTAPHLETADLRGRNVDLVQIYAEQFLVWASWGLLAWPALALAAWLIQSTRSPLAFLSIMVPASLVASYGFLQVDYIIHKPSKVEWDQWQEEWREARQARHASAMDDESGQVVGRGRPPEWARGMGRGPGGFRGDDGPRTPEQRTFERQRIRWRAMRAGMERPDLSFLHWRFRWIQNALIFWSILGLGGGLAAFLGLRRKERLTAELELRASELRGELTHAQLDTLKGQLQPHFLFNALHSVGGLIRAGEEQQALSTLATIGLLLRSTLDLGDQAEIRLADELQIAERYIGLERIRFGDRLRVEIDADDEFKQALIPTLLLLPLVENAVKYGITPQLDGGFLEIIVSREGKSLKLCVRDDGAGFPASLLSGASSENGHRSIGLENTRRRLQALYGDGQSLEAGNSAEGGAEVRISLPFHTETILHSESDG